MEGSPLLDAMPRVLADAVRREGGDSVLAELATGAMSHCTELDNVTELNELTHVMAKAVLAAYSKEKNLDFDIDDIELYKYS